MKFYRRLPTIKALTFDLDDTLYDNRPHILKMEQKVMEWLAQEHPATQGVDWKAVKKSVVQQSPALKNDVTAWRLAQLTHGFSQSGYSAEQAQSAAQDGVDVALFWRSEFQVPQASIELLEQLSLRYPLVAITNGNVDLEKIGLGSIFSATYKAGFDGRAKPYSDMFELAQSHLSLPAQSILHVGDHLKTDVMGAKRAGYSACWLNEGRHTLATHPHARAVPDVEITRISQLMDVVL